MPLRRLQALFLERPIFTSNLVASGGTMLTLFLAYLFHFVMTRMLVPADYGDLSILIGVFSVATVPAASISSVLTRELSLLGAKGQQARANFVFFKYLRLTVLASSAVFLVLAFAAFFAFSSPRVHWAAVAIFVAIPLNYAINVVSSYFQSREDILALSAIGVAREAVKLFFAVTLVYAGFGMFGAMAAFPLGFALVFCVLLVYLRRLHKSEECRVSVKRSLVLMLATALISSGFVYLDLFFVRLFFGNAFAGFYNVASVTSKVLVYVSSGLVFVVFPKSSKLSYTDRNAMTHLIMQSVLFLVPILAGFVLLAPWLIGFFYPPQYSVSVLPFSILCLGMFFYGIFIILLNVMWSQRQEVFPVALLAGAFVLQAVLLNVLVPWLGMQGAALSTLAVSAILAGGAFYKVRHSIAAARVGRPTG